MLGRLRSSRCVILHARNSVGLSRLPRSMTVNIVQRVPAGDDSKGHSQREFSHSTAVERDHRQIPKTNAKGSEESYVLTLLTSPELHKSMNLLRNVYFPVKLNRVAAHLTLFHALPESYLESEILPAIEHVAQQTAPYRIRAASAFRLSKGVGIKVDDDIDHANDSKQGRNMTRQIHAQLRKQWSSWLSEQDSSPVRLHYTVMNKVTDSQVVDEALTQISGSLSQQKDISGGHFVPNRQHSDAPVGNETMQSLTTEGVVQGLTLWRYNHGTWAKPQEFLFQQKQD